MTDTELLDYIEKHGGTLRLCYDRTKLESGEFVDYTWQYSSESLGILSARTAREAIQLHIECQKSRKV